MPTPTQHTEEAVVKISTKNPEKLTSERREEQRRRLNEQLKGRKKLPLVWNEYGNYLMTEDE